MKTTLDTNLLVFAHRGDSVHLDARIAALCLQHGVKELWRWLGEGEEKRVQNTSTAAKKSP